MPEPEPDIETTAAYAPAVTADFAPTRQLTIAPDIGRPLPDNDLRVVLRKRLRFLAYLLTGGLVVSLFFTFSNTTLLSDPWSYPPLAVFTLGPIAASILRSRRPLSLRQLRMVELVLVGAFYVMWAVVLAVVYPTMSYPREPPPLWFSFIVGYAVSVPWSFLIIFYGIFIPNTWQRCATVVGIIAVTPLVISWASGMLKTVAGSHPYIFFFVAAGLWLTVAVAIAIYGAHRIEGLRQEIVAARRLGQYILGRKLGAGGMGEVYLAEHLLLRRPCAIKLIHPDHGNDPSSLDRFEREVQATATLTHPNTIQVYDYGRADDGTFYYAMEYLPGLTLDDLVRQYGPIPPGRAVHIIRQICGALHEAHAIGLIHRDIKPNNIILCERGGQGDVAKLLDFGLVVIRRPGESDGEAAGFAGTPAYMSAEQAAGRGDLDGRTDLYSLGCVIYFLLTGEPPFPRDSVRETLAAHRTEPAAFGERWTKTLPEDLQAAVLRCMAKSPEERFADAESLERALAQCACAESWTRDMTAAWWQQQKSSAMALPAAAS